MKNYGFSSKGILKALRRNESACGQLQLRELISAYLGIAESEAQLCHPKLDAQRRMSQRIFDIVSDLILKTKLAIMAIMGCTAPRCLGPQREFMICSLKEIKLLNSKKK